MEREEFLRVVAEAIDRLPPYFRKKTANLSVVVDDLPSPETLRRQGLQNRLSLLGLYEGVPIKNRGISYSNVLPDRITLYQKPIEAAARNEESLPDKVREVLIHEVAHHFGFSEKKLAVLERETKQSG